MKVPSELVKNLPESQILEIPVETTLARPPVANYGYGYAYDSEVEDKKHLLDYWRAVRKRLWLIIGITVLITMLAAIYMARQPDVYQARVRVQVDTEDTSGFGATAKVPSIIVGNTNDPIYFNTQLQILTSPGLLRRVAKTLDLEHNPDFFRPQSSQSRSTWQSLLRMMGFSKEDKKDDKGRLPNELRLNRPIAPGPSHDDFEEVRKLEGFVGALQAGLKVDPVKETRTSVRETRLIDISFQHLNPRVAAQVVNTVADVYILSNLEKKTGKSISAADFMQKRIAELQAEIRKGEEQLITYAKDRNILLEGGQNTVVERLTGLNRQLMDAENERKMAEANYQASLAPEAAAARVESTARLTAEAESKLAELRVSREKLLVEHTEKWPAVKEIDKQIAELEKQVRETRERAINTLLTNQRTQYLQALARERVLRADFEKQRSATITQNEAAINYRIIQQEIETNKSLLDGLLQRSKENEVLQSGIANNISVIDYATKLGGPIGPARTQNIALAFLLSLGCGIGFALLLDYLDDSLHSADEVERVLHLPALAVIPTIGGHKRRRALPAAAALQLNGNGQNGHHPELLINSDSRSALSETYRQLRTTVLLSTPGRAPKTLLVTSSTPAEGKTSAAVNTALILAQTGASVLVIDADMRHPRLHSIFGLENDRGLSTILASEMSEAEMRSLLEHHEASGLYLLTSGPLPANPAELLGSEQMQRLLVNLGSTFTHIVIDSPPVSYFTDSVLIASIVDGVLLVVHGGKSSRQVVRRSRKLLQDVGAKIFGVVLNHARTSQPDYSYSYYYD